MNIILFLKKSFQYMMEYPPTPMWLCCRMDDAEAQEDELLALASIYDVDVFSTDKEGERPGGQFSACLDLPQPFVIRAQSKQTTGGW